MSLEALRDEEKFVPLDYIRSKLFQEEKLLETIATLNNLLFKTRRLLRIAMVLPFKVAVKRLVMASMLVAVRRNILQSIIPRLVATKVASSMFVGVLK